MAKAGEIDLVVITPEREVVRGQSPNVVIPAHDGELGVRQLRAPLMCELGIGELRYDQQGQTRHVYIDGGFAQVNDDHVMVLTAHALPAEQVTAEIVTNAEAAAAEEGIEADERNKRRKRASALRSLRA